ncbi:energy-coupling factor ABC transporter ATP-binding protein [Citricoccus sp. NR2]|uniref:energy-coupling factor ABC transporter ATP-binding protein n=1 Tax=Citricoccus sp. NR2 TaxID=3004095 RepID=UPI0022DD3DA4|nr:ABC transporter ATP-binding protein [Citricoccus sp. NR2]WBL20093.1 ABC transporter ATP-binding protein [Citricoccus sp. NR2]
MIRIEQLSVAVEDPSSGTGSTELLHGITAELTARTTAVIGENGSGKSTLARAIGGLQAPSSGSISVNGIDTVSQAKQLRREVGFIFASPAAQVIMPTVREDVALTLRGRGLAKAEVSARVEHALAEHELTELADRPCLSLSSGQLQRLALCSVWVGEPSLVIADEPTSLLDARHSRLVTARLLEHAPQLLLVTHDLELARRCEEAVLIDDGELAAQGAPDDVIAEYEQVLAREVR